MISSALPRVLMVYANPASTATPVAPYGMERVARSLELAGCQVQLLAPWIEADPIRVFRAALADPPALVGFSLRNIDDALVVRGDLGKGDIDTQFFLDEIQPLIQLALHVMGPDRVIIGGPGFTAGPLPILRFFGARWGIRGPADDLMWQIGRSLVHGASTLMPADPRVVEARAVESSAVESSAVGPSTEHTPAHQTPGSRTPFAADWIPLPEPVPRMSHYLGMTLAREGRAAVQVSAGCDRRCVFCVEARFAGKKVYHRPVEQIIAEVAALAESGVRRFWLSASELNLPDERHAIALMRALKPYHELDFQFFLQVAPVSHALLDAIEDAGIDPTELSFEFGHMSEKILRAGGGPANLRSILSLVNLWLQRGYRGLSGSILLGAHPRETQATLDEAIARTLQIDGMFPDGLSLAYATGARVYPESPLADLIAADPEDARPHLYSLPGQPIDPSFVRPVVYCRPMPPRALMRWTRSQLSSSRGSMGAMNTETPTQHDELQAESWVNRGLWRIQEGEPDRGRRCFVTALELAPNHKEALAQLGLVLANHLGEPGEACEVFQSLLDLLDHEDPRRSELSELIHRLEHP